MGKTSRASTVNSAPSSPLAEVTLGVFACSRLLASFRSLAEGLDEAGRLVGGEGFSAPRLLPVQLVFVSVTLHPVDCTLVGRAKVSSFITKGQRTRRCRQPSCISSTTSWDSMQYARAAEMAPIIDTLCPLAHVSKPRDCSFGRPGLPEPLQVSRNGCCQTQL